MHYGALFYEPTYTADLRDALENGDENLVGTVAELMLKNIKGGSYSSEATEEIIRLYGEGYENVLPRSVPTLTAKQKKTFKAVYTKADAVISSAVSDSRYSALTSEAQAKALKYIYEAYYSQAKTAALGTQDCPLTKAGALIQLCDPVTLFIETAYSRTLTEDRAKLTKSRVASYDADTQACILYASGYRSADVLSAIAALCNKQANAVELLAVLGIENEI